MTTPEPSMERKAATKAGYLSAFISALTIFLLIITRILPDNEFLPFVPPAIGIGVWLFTYQTIRTFKK